MDKLTVEWLGINELIEYKRNAKLHPPEQIEQIAKSIKLYGFNDPIAIDADNTIIEGHGRKLAALLLEMPTVPCIRLSHLTDTQKRAYIIAHNKLTMNTGFDEELLKLELDDLINSEDFSLDVDSLGFSLDDIDEVLGAEEPPEEKEPVPEPPKVPKSKLGDIYQLGRHRLLCGDSTDKATVELLMDGKKADMVFTDPPFPNNSEIMHDMIKDIDKSFDIALAVCSGVQVWFWDNLSFPPFNKKCTSKYIWHKTNGWQAGHFETMYCFHDDENRHEQLVFSVPNVGVEMDRSKLGNHPTPKPPTLGTAIFSSLHAGKIILDLFGGSGSTLIACEDTGRGCYMMELDPKYIDVIIERWENHTGEKAEQVKWTS